MKTRILKVTAALAVVCLVAGCIALSVYPFYTPKDLIYDPNVAGRWVEVGNTNSVLRFTGMDGKFYLLTQSDNHDTNCFEAHLFRLKRYQFLDLLTTNRADYQMPVHLISKVVHTDTNLELQFLDFGWLAGLLRTNPGVLRHIVVPAEPGDTNDNMFYLTAETKDLQKFLLKHAEDTNAFNPASASELKLAPE